MKKKQSSPDHLFHQKVVQLLSAYLDGQVDDRERYLVERHLSTCPVCQRDLESLRQVVRLLNRLPPVTPPHAFTLQPEWVAPARPPVWRWLFGIPSLATGLAALMCIIVLAGVLLYNQLVSYRPGIPLARVTVTYRIPDTPTVASVPDVISPATPAISGSTVARDERGPSVESPPPGPTPAAPIQGQPGELPVLTPAPSPEAPPEVPAPMEGYGTPSPTPTMVQPERESVARTQPSPQRTEELGEAAVEEGVRAQRYEGAVSPEPSLTAPPTAGAMMVSAATEPPAAQPSTEEVITPPQPSPALGTAVPPTIEMPVAPTPSGEKAAAPSELPPAITTPVEPAEIPGVTAAVPTTPPPVEAPAALAEPSPIVETEVAPSEAELPAVPAAVPTTPPPVEAPAALAEPSPAVEAEAAPSEAELPAVPAAVPTASPTEETVPSTAKEVAPVTPTVVEPGIGEAPSIGPTEPEPTPTRIPIPVRDLRLTIKPGLIHIEGALPLPPGQPIQAELWREGQVLEWAIPETQRGEVQEEGRFELELRAQPDHPDFDLFKIPPARYEVRIVPLKFESPVEARIPFDTFPPATKQP
jgi:hypothetical protein